MVIEEGEEWFCIADGKSVRVLAARAGWLMLRKQGGQPYTMSEGTFVRRHSHVLENKERIALARKIHGALKSTIDAHGPIEKTNIGSAVKRIVGLLVGPAKEKD